MHRHAYNCIIDVLKNPVGSRYPLLRVSIKADGAVSHIVVKFPPPPNGLAFQNTMFELIRNISSAASENLEPVNCRVYLL